MKSEAATTTIEKALTEYNIPDATMQALAIFKQAEKLECVDKDSRQIIGRHRADIKTLRPQVDKVRIALNKVFAGKNKAMANTIESALNQSFDVFDKKIKAYDSVAEAKAKEKRLAREKIEHDRVGLIQYHMDGLELDCKPLDYGASKNEIVGAIENLHLSVVSAVDFDSKTEEAEQMKATALANAEKALESRIKWEKDQAEAAETKAANDAVAEKLAAEKATFEKKQAKVKAEQKKKDAAAKKLATQEAEKTRKATEKLEAGRKALEEEKAEIARVKQAEEDRKLAEQYHYDWNNAHAINFALIYDTAIADNIDFDVYQAERLKVDEKARKDKLKKDKARAKLIKVDQKTIQSKVDHVLSLLPEFETLECKTEAGNKIVAHMVFGIVEALNEAEKSGVELV